MANKDLILIQEDATGRKITTTITLGANGTVLSSNGTVASFTTPAGGLTNFTESNNTYSSQVGVKLLATNAGANVDLALQPKGTGAFYLGDYADGTTTGGNNRGTRAVDFQVTRDTNTKVASGNRATIINGHDNISSGAYSLSSGLANTASGQTSLAIGDSNTASATLSIAIGNSNIASSTFAVAIGQSNTASTNINAVAIGFTNVVSSIKGFAIGANNAVNTGDFAMALGYNNTSTAQGAFSAGESNTSSAVRSFTYGYSNTASAGYSSAKGYTVQANKVGQMTYGHSSISLGKRQHSFLTSVCQSTTTSDVEAFLDNSSARLTLGTNQTWGYEITAVGMDTGSAKRGRYVRTGVIFRGASAATTTLIGSVITPTSDVYDGTFLGVVTITADTTNGSLKIVANSGETATYNWMFKISIVELQT